MRCPKCRYISFGSATRCRNCGYEFSFSEEAQPLDLPIQAADEPVGPLDDLPLSPPAANGDRHARPPVQREEPAPATRAVSRFDLPLFTSDDAPMVTPPAVPRPPLSVRRPAPVLVRTREDPGGPVEEPQLDLGDEPARDRAPRPFVRHRRDAESAIETQDAAADRVSTAPVFRRLIAGILDLLILGSIDAAVLYFTVRVLGLPVENAWSLPKIPLVAFLLLLDGGYFVLFTAAGGQTIGKMATGIRVVMHSGDDRRIRVGFGPAVVRAAAYFASLLPAGLGFVPILVTPDGRTIHDRLSDTRVVRA